MTDDEQHSSLFSINAMGMQCWIGGKFITKEEYSLIKLLDSVPAEACKCEID